MSESLLSSSLTNFHVPDFVRYDSSSPDHHHHEPLLRVWAHCSRDRYFSPDAERVRRTIGAQKEAELEWALAECVAPKRQRKRRSRRKTRRNAAAAALLLEQSAQATAAAESVQANHDDDNNNDGNDDDDADGGDEDADEFGVEDDEDDEEDYDALIEELLSERPKVRTGSERRIKS
jgi:hypothetical protein